MASSVRSSDHGDTVANATSVLLSRQPPPKGLPRGLCRRQRSNPVPSRHPGSYLKLLPTFNSCVGCRDYVKYCMRSTTLREAKQRLVDKPDSWAAFTKCVEYYEQIQESAGKCGRVTQASKLALDKPPEFLTCAQATEIKGEMAMGVFGPQEHFQKALPKRLVKPHHWQGETL